MLLPIVQLFSCKATLLKLGSIFGSKKKQHRRRFIIIQGGVVAFHAHTGWDGMAGRIPGRSSLWGRGEGADGRWGTIGPQQGGEPRGGQRREELPQAEKRPCGGGRSGVENIMHLLGCHQLQLNFRRKTLAVKKPDNLGGCKIRSDHRPLATSQMGISRGGMELRSAREP